MTTLEIDLIERFLDIQIKMLAEIQCMQNQITKLKERIEELEK